MRRSAIAYSTAEMAWLEVNRLLIISDYHAAFTAEFCRQDVTAAHLHGLRKRKGWKVGREPGRTKGRLRKFSAEEFVWLRDNSGLVISAYNRDFVAAFDRDDATAKQLNAFRKRQGWKTGRTGKFSKGHVSHNKGKTMPFNAKSAATQFKKGGVPHTFRGAGHESIGKDGYVFIIVDEINPWTGASTRRIHLHRWLWEQQNGPVPKGHILKCLDGNRGNTHPSNWQAIPKGMLPRLNGKSGRNYDTAPAALKPTIMAVAKLEHGSRSHSAQKRNSEVAS